MGILKISDQLHEELRKASDAFSRSVNAQAEYWIKIGLLAELHPQANYQQLVKLLLKNKDKTLEELVDDQTRD